MTQKEGLYTQRLAYTDIQGGQEQTINSISQINLNINKDLNQETIYNQTNCQSMKNNKT